MNLSFCVRSPQRIASGANQTEKQKAETGNTSDSRRYSGIFPQLWPEHDPEVQGWRVSAAGPIFDQRLGAEKTDHIGAQRIEVARPARAREFCTSGRK